MKNIAILAITALSLIGAVPEASAIDPGKYHISCLGERFGSTSGKQALRGYLLTIDESGKPTLTVPIMKFWEDVSTKVEHVELTRGAKDLEFVLHARYTQSTGSKTIRYVVTLAFDGLRGAGVEARLGRTQRGVSTYFIEACISGVDQPNKSE